MAMNGEMIENTVKFKFPSSAPRPTWVEIAGFLKELASGVTEMETAYKMSEDRSLCIKYRSTTAMEEALRSNSGPIKFKYSSGKTIDVRMSPAGMHVRYVRIFNVPPEVTDDVLSSVLGKYGKIVRMIREKFSSDLGLDHMFNGVRGLDMVIEKEIPPSVDVLHWKANVFYEELRNKCFVCQQEGHQKNACPQREKRNQQVESKPAENPTPHVDTVIEVAVASDEQEMIVLEEDIIEVIQSEEDLEGSEPPGGSETKKPVVYRNEYERDLAERWEKHEAEKRKRQEEYRMQEESMQRRYQESLRERERLQMEHWTKCEAEKKSRQEAYNRSLSVQPKTHSVNDKSQSPPNKFSRKK